MRVSGETPERESLLRHFQFTVLLFAPVLSLYHTGEHLSSKFCHFHIQTLGNLLCFSCCFCSKVHKREFSHQTSGRRSNRASRQSNPLQISSKRKNELFKLLFDSCAVFGPTNNNMISQNNNIVNIFSEKIRTFSQICEKMSFCTINPKNSASF